MLARFPGQAMQAALVFAIRNDIQSHKGVSAYEKCEKINPSDDVLVSNRDVRTPFEFRDDNSGELSWRNKMGFWQITNYNFLPKEKKNTEKSAE